MFTKKEHSQIFGNPDLETNKKAIDKAIDFLDVCMPLFPAYLKAYPSKSPKEKRVSRKLATFLNNESRARNSIFMILMEYDETESERIDDFGFIKFTPFRGIEEGDNAFFVMEAKRLPTPTPPKSREKEYVEGNLGGIERFKRGHHGAGLAQSAMVAYVQTETCTYWHTKVNGWIQDLIDTPISSDIVWHSDDLLVFKNQFDTTFKYQSKNRRICQDKADEITLLHYFLNFTI
jgi:hypothetical protein